MAKIGNIVNKNRNELEKVIPLETPYTISIDPSNLCNFKCKFCATHSDEYGNKIEKQNMDFYLYKKIVNDLSEFPQKIKVLRLTGNGEPTINKKLPEMIKYAKKKNIAEYIEIITNGSLLNKELNRKLVDSGLDRIRISIEALDEENYEKITGVKVNLNSILKNIKDLYDNKKQCNVYIKTVDVTVKSNEDKRRFYEMFSDKCDQMFVDNVIPLWSDFKGRDSIIKYDNGMHGQEVKNIKVCPFIFYMLYINSNGDVTCCCADWKRKFIIGNVRNNKIKEIWQGNLLRNFWIDMLSGKKDIYEMCKKCLYPAFDCNDDIDMYADEILERLCD